MDGGWPGACCLASKVLISDIPCIVYVHLLVRLGNTDHQPRYGVLHSDFELGSFPFVFGVRVFRLFGNRGSGWRDLERGWMLGARLGGGCSANRAVIDGDPLSFPFWLPSFEEIAGISSSLFFKKIIKIFFQSILIIYTIF